MNTDVFDMHKQFEFDKIHTGITQELTTLARANFIYKLLCKNVYDRVLTIIISMKQY